MPDDSLVRRAGKALATAALLVGGRYGMVERVSMVLVVLFTLSNIAAVLLLADTPFRLTGENLAEGLSFRPPDELVTAFAVVSVWTIFLALLGTTDGGATWTVGFDALYWRRDQR